MAVEARPWASSLRRVSIVLISCEGFIAAILSGANRCRLTLIDEADWTLGFDPVFGVECCRGLQDRSRLLL
jgi:hypothetical protein